MFVVSTRSTLPILRHNSDVLDDDNLLEMQRLVGRHPPTLSPNPSHDAAHPLLVLRASINNEQVTTVPTAWMMLKSTGVGHNLENTVEGKITLIPKQSHLSPSSHSNCSLPNTCASNILCNMQSSSSRPTTPSRHQLGEAANVFTSVG